MQELNNSYDYPWFLENGCFEFKDSLGYYTFKGHVCAIKDCIKSYNTRIKDILEDNAQTNNCILQLSGECVKINKSLPDIPQPWIITFETEPGIQNLNAESNVKKIHIGGKSIQTIEPTKIDCKSCISQNVVYLPNNSEFSENYPTIVKEKVSTPADINRKRDELAQHMKTLLLNSYNKNITDEVQKSLKWLCDNQSIMNTINTKKFAKFIKICTTLKGGSSSKIFYKGYYYKIRTEKKKSFIVTKNEGQVSVSTVNKWRSKHEKQQAKQKKDKQNKK